LAAVGQIRPAPNLPSAPRSPGIRTPLFLLGVALALLSFVAMVGFGILSANRGTGGSSVPVVVATRDIAAREPILPDMVSITSIPSAGVPSHSFVRASDLAGYAAIVPIYKGQVISANVVASSPDALSPQAYSYLPIPTGWVAITLPTSELQGVGGYPEPGDYINVIATLNTGLFSPINPHMVTDTVFPSVHIIKVGPPSSVPGAAQQAGVTSSLTVVMTLCDAQYMDWLITNATLKYVLLSYHDYGGGSPAADPRCPSTVAPGPIGPTAVDARWKFTKA
jgi:pilus assembly protein CpaB